MGGSELWESEHLVVAVTTHLVASEAIHPEAVYSSHSFGVPCFDSKSFASGPEMQATLLSLGYV